MRDLVVALSALVAIGLGWGAVALSRDTGPAELWQVPTFELTDQTGQPLRSEDLRGRAWIGSFIYTNCPDICPTISARLAALSDSLSSEGVGARDLRLVSFTVDPERDTPEVLAEYAARWGATDAERWAFATGEPAEVRRIVSQGFYMPATRVTAADAAAAASGGAGHADHGADQAARPASPGTAAENAATSEYLVAHTDRVVLVDRSGRVRGVYSSIEPAGLDSLRADLGALLR